jgi:hypothetical protein
MTVLVEDIDCSHSKHEHRFTDPSQACQFAKELTDKEEIDLVKVYPEERPLEIILYYYRGEGIIHNCQDNPAPDYSQLGPPQ